jgi:hypothetical protein
MAQLHYHQGRFGRGAETAWLSQLIASLDRVAESDLRAARCDDAVLSALQAQLSRPPCSDLGCDLRGRN